MPGFRYNLGFSGSTFQMKISSDEEKKADSLLIENRNEFDWFPHMWSHLQPHNFTNENYVDKSWNMTLKQHMESNRKFAETHDISVDNQYSVAPHHSGLIYILTLLIVLIKKNKTVKTVTVLSSLCFRYTNYKWSNGTRVQWSDHIFDQ